MNRETKYRAHHKNLKIEVDVLLIDWLNELVDLEGGLIEQEFGDVVLIRYTGLKDKYGVEIYEGDIFWSDHSGEYTYVEYQEGAFYIIHTVTSEKTLLSKEHGDWIVRGSIYGNPELLECEAE